MATPGPSSNNQPTPLHASQADHQIPLANLSQTPSGQGVDQNQPNATPDAAHLGQPQLLPPRSPSNERTPPGPTQCSNLRAGGAGTCWRPCSLGCVSMAEGPAARRISAIIITMNGTENHLAEFFVWMAFVAVVGSVITTVLTNVIMACPTVGESSFLEKTLVVSDYVALLSGGASLICAAVVTVWKGSLPLGYRITIICVLSAFAAPSFLAIFLLIWRGYPANRSANGGL
ncbi:hypothetical protein EDD17DRAFT_1509388 [Pisolithus thermaeus]|nr:hypothetical protein EV401DRAFT_2065662 [Pisolithus croceorrhizus]KAI6161168.1 hypothetical protein EDD17DRAFT_1509388 [Pisolithus thermaeus]